MNGVTTAATIWFVTVLGLLFGGGNLYLGIAGSLIAFTILWFLKYIENCFSREYRGSLHLTFSSDSSIEADLRQRLLASGCKIAHWSALYEPVTTIATLDCELQWSDRASRIPETPSAIEQLRTLPGIRSVAWKE